MARNSSAGSLRQKLDFQQPGPSVDEFGNPLPGKTYQTAFTDMAEVIPRMGSEPVMAARLQGLQPVTIRVRSHSLTRSIDATYRTVDARNSTVYSITSPPVNVDQKNQYIEMLATTGSHADGGPSVG